MNDPVEQFLVTDFSSRPPPGLCQTILAETTRVLRRRRLRRRLAWAAGLAACFVAGMGTMLLWHAVALPEQRAHRLHPEKNLAAKHDESAVPSTIPEPPPSLVELEWRA